MCARVSTVGGTPISAYSERNVCRTMTYQASEANVIGGCGAPLCRYARRASAAWPCSRAMWSMCAVVSIVGDIPVSPYTASNVYRTMTYQASEPNIIAM